MKLKKCLWIAVGCVGLGLGGLGSVLPLIPSVPFLIIAAIGFAKGSERMNQWFVGTKLYRNNLESYVAGQGMSRQTKLRIMALVTVMMSVGFVMMLTKALYLPCVLLVCIWVIHLIYFVFGVKTYQTT